jgi:hypothetical protein
MSQRTDGLYVLSENTKVNGYPTWVKDADDEDLCRVLYNTKRGRWGISGADLSDRKNFCSASHDGAMPNEVRWGKILDGIWAQMSDMSCEMVDHQDQPPYLKITGTSQRTDGIYLLEQNSRVNGYPTWVKDRDNEDHYRVIYNMKTGRWGISARDLRSKKNFCSDVHDGAMPHLVRWGKIQDGAWVAKDSITCEEANQEQRTQNWGNDLDTQLDQLERELAVELRQEFGHQAIVPPSTNDGSHSPRSQPASNSSVGEMEDHRCDFNVSENESVEEWRCDMSSDYAMPLPECPPLLAPEGPGGPVGPPGPSEEWRCDLSSDDAMPLPECWFNDSSPVASPRERRTLQNDDADISEIQLV